MVRGIAGPGGPRTQLLRRALVRGAAHHRHVGDRVPGSVLRFTRQGGRRLRRGGQSRPYPEHADRGRRDRKSTRLNSSHSQISYAVFCLKKKKKQPKTEKQALQPYGLYTHATNAASTDSARTK